MSEGGDRGPDGMHGKDVSAPLECVECKSLSGPEARFWRSYRIDDPSEDEPPALAFYCPSCAEREFGAIRISERYGQS